MEAASRRSHTKASNLLLTEQPSTKDIAAVASLEKELEKEIDSNQADYISVLPAELLLHILRFVGISYHSILARVSKTFYDYSQDEATFGALLKLKRVFRNICTVYAANRIHKAQPLPSQQPQQEASTIKDDGKDAKDIESINTKNTKESDWDALLFCSDAMKQLREAVEALLGKRETKESKPKKRKEQTRFTFNTNNTTERIKNNSDTPMTEKERREFIVYVSNQISANNVNYFLSAISPASTIKIWPHCALLRCLTDYLEEDDDVYIETDAVMSHLSCNEETDEEVLLLTGGPKLIRVFTKLSNLEYPQSSRLNLLVPEFLLRNPRDASSLVQTEAYKHLNAERYEEAVFLFDSVLKTKPYPSADLLIDTARAHWGIKDWITTADLYAIGIRKRPSLRAVCFADCAYAHLKARRYEEAVVYYETAIEKDPKLGARHWGDYGFVLFKLEEWARAAEVIGIALEREPSLFAECYVNYGLVQHRLGAPDKAAQYLRVAIDRGVLEDVRAVPFLNDFLEVFEKEGNCAEYIAKCLAKRAELENQTNNL